ncbi:hypothetical protein ACFWBV_30440, partial [Streptomyces sp. NPDC060030]|uniref:hypothetical protein n=1 Tax=Streptomyces sp. NPDC060030 TaxID=3347042 RepID=UPI00369760B4
MTTVPALLGVAVISSSSGAEGCVAGMGVDRAGAGTLASPVVGCGSGCVVGFLRVLMPVMPVMPPVTETLVMALLRAPAMKPKTVASIFPVVARP